MSVEQFWKKIGHARIIKHGSGPLRLFPACHQKADFHVFANEDQTVTLACSVCEQPVVLLTMKEYLRLCEKV